MTMTRCFFFIEVVFVPGLEAGGGRHESSETLASALGLLPDSVQPTESHKILTWKGPLGIRVQLPAARRATWRFTCVSKSVVQTRLDH